MLVSRQADATHLKPMHRFLPGERHPRQRVYFWRQLYEPPLDRLIEGFVRTEVARATVARERVLYSVPEALPGGSRSV